jgi:DNA processing protein
MAEGVINREDFPRALLEWRGCPECLWFLGDKGLLQSDFLVSVVGTRNPSHEGILRTRKLVQTLVSEGVTVVSGLAQGVDYVAHSTTLGLGGATIAVMGTPIDDCYPKEHLGLKSTIASAGLVLSQFEPGSPSRRYNFPRRNETMAAMSAITIVTEATPNSGTRHQVAAAIKLGRRVGFLASLAAQQIPWIEEALQSELAFVIDSPSKIVDVIGRCRIKPLVETETAAVDPCLSVSLGTETVTEHVDFDRPAVGGRAVEEHEAGEGDNTVSGERNPTIDPPGGLMSWIKGMLGWVFGYGPQNRPKK